MKQKTFNQTRTTFLDRTEKRVMENSTSNWGRKDFLETKQRKNRENFMEKKIDFLQNKMEEHYEELKIKYENLEIISESLQKRITINLKQNESTIQKKLSELQQEEKVNLEIMQTEIQQRKIQEKKILKFLDDKYLSLKSNLQEESQERIEELTQLQKALEIDLPKLNEDLNSELKKKEDFEHFTNTKYFNELGVISNNLDLEVKSREEHDQAIYDMIGDITERTRVEIEEVKKDRKVAQDNILDLLENACTKINSVM